MSGLLKKMLPSSYVQSGLEAAEGLCFFGISVDELSRKELVAALGHLAKEKHDRLDREERRDRARVARWKERLK